MLNLFVKYHQPHLINKSIAHVNYIAKRAGVDFTPINRMGDLLNTRHGLFDINGTADIDKYLDELKKHKGVVYKGLLSMSKDESHQLGYDTKRSWYCLMCANYARIANTLKIPISNLRLVMAYHPEGTRGHNPHLHFVAYEKIPNKTRLNEYAINKKDLNNLRYDINKTFYNTQEQIQIKNDSRAYIMRSADTVLSLRNTPILKNELPELTKMIDDLRVILPKSGRLDYKLMPSDVKVQIDRIVDYIKNTKAIRPYYQQYISAVKESLKVYGLSDEKINDALNKAENDIDKRLCNRVMNEIRRTIQEQEQEINPSIQKKIKNEMNNSIDVALSVVHFFKRFFKYNDRELQQFLQRERINALKEKARHKDGRDREI